MKKMTAYKIAMQAIKLEQKRYYPGHAEYMRTGVLFDWAGRDHKKWVRLDQAKGLMEDAMYEGEQMGLFAPGETIKVEV